MILLIAVAGYVIYYNIKKKKTAQVEETINVDDKTYTIGIMTEFVKKRLDEITKINLYDIRAFRRGIKKKKE